MKEDSAEYAPLWDLGLKSIQALETEAGVLASGRGELYGCIFGRDSLIVALELLRVYEKSGDKYFLLLVQKILRNLAELQGREHNIESGEEPGKIIHEYRTEGYSHLIGGERPWYVYPDGILRNFDSVDVTPLFLIAAERYERASGEKTLTKELRHSIDAALAWLMGHRGFVTYHFHPERKSGGLMTQSWMDSEKSVFYEQSSERPPYPVAALEVQAYAWAALRAWGEEGRAKALKQKFNETFVIKTPKRVTLAYAVDGAGKRLSAARSSMGHVLWAAYLAPQKSLPECILNDEYIKPLRDRVLSRDLFVPHAGIRTLSNRSLHYNPMSYHNGSIWPHDTAMLAEGLEHFGFTDDARRVRAALLRAYVHFKTPVELFSWDRKFIEYNDNGQRACQVQAWSAASLLAALEAEK